MTSPKDLFDLEHFAHRDLFDECQFAWDALKRLEDYIRARLATGVKASASQFPGATIVGDVVIGAGVKIESGAYISGPTIIGDRCQVRHGAYIRGHVVLGDECTVGHASEIKHAIFLRHAIAAHFAYVGDSILGAYVNLGAGTKLANLPMVSGVHGSHGRPTIKIGLGDDLYDTGLTKLGGILGDRAQTGCNCVLGPGCVVGRGTLIYPNVALRKGVYRPQTIIKLRQEQVIEDLRP